MERLISHPSSLCIRSLFLAPIHLEGFSGPQDQDSLQPLNHGGLSWEKTNSWNLKRQKSPSTLLLHSQLPRLALPLPLQLLLIHRPPSPRPPPHAEALHAHPHRLPSSPPHPLLCHRRVNQDLPSQHGRLFLLPKKKTRFSRSIWAPFFILITWGESGVERWGRGRKKVRGSERV